MKRIVTVEDRGNAGPYLEALQLAGIEATFGTSLDGASGLMLMGGDDVNPARYGEPRHPETEDPDDGRDELECALIAKALERDLPILAICRGMQILNVAQGGTLVQHLENHRQKTIDKSLSAHCVEIVPGSTLATIAGGELKAPVNSRHHQAVARLGQGLIMSATDTRDGVIEAIERPDKRFVVGVQWHPENQTAEKDSIARRLFDAFATALH
jgi:putative glutamine amidotransferase